MSFLKAKETASVCAVITSYSIHYTKLYDDKIENGRLTPSFKTDREHVAHLKQKIAERDTQTLCPKCGRNNFV